MTKKWQPLVCLENITKSFDGTTILDQLDLTIYENEFVTLLGPSGCGKTTVLRLIAGFEEPDSGDIQLAGQSITTQLPEHRHINTVFQSYALFPHMTVFENIAFGLRMNKVESDEIQQRVNDALLMVQLTELATRYPGQLSGGQQQRVAIARAAVNKPRVLLLDESLSALDYKLRKQMQLELKQLQRRLGITFVFVTHDQEEALSMSDRILVMHQGHVVQQGTPREIYETPENLFVARFIGEINIFDACIGQRLEHNRYQASFNGITRQIVSDQKHQPGDLVHILLRPEDMRLYSPQSDKPENAFPGKVIERTYKGMTLDSIVELDNGKQLLISAFFDEDDPDFDHRIGEQVFISWVEQREVILNHEKI